MHEGLQFALLVCISDLILWFQEPLADWVRAASVEEVLFLYFIRDAQRGRTSQGRSHSGERQLAFRTSNFKFRLGATLLHPTWSPLGPGHLPALCRAWLLRARARDLSRWVPPPRLAVSPRRPLALVAGGAPGSAPGPCRLASDSSASVCDGAGEG